MSHTNRIYNAAGYWFVHPYHEMCMGKCSCCKALHYKLNSNVIRRTDSNELRQALKMEGPHEQSSG